MSEATLARGTYTFLFTDIEGSTNLERAIGRERYGELRDRHRAILRNVWEAHHGDEQGTEGDSFFVVFASAAAAVQAAVELAGVAVLVGVAPAVAWAASAISFVVPALDLSKRSVVRAAGV